MFGTLSPYPCTKPTNHLWIGTVPEHWSVLPNRALFEEIKDREHPDEQMLSVTISHGVIGQRALLDSGSKKDSSKTDKSAYKLVCPGDMAYNKMRAWQGALGVSSLRGIVSPAYIVVRLRHSTYSPLYFHYLCRTPHFAKEAERWSYGITSDMWSLRPEHFRSIYSPAPPPEEQAAIVRFLDHATRRLDKAIRAKRKVIALLNEQKQAIIHRAVTRGLDPSAPLKDSGIPWLGKIPAHWECWRLNRLARIGNGSTPSRAKPAYWTNGRYPWLNSSQVNRGRIDSSDQFVTADALRECHLPRVPSGSVLVAITGQGKTRGTAAILQIEATINQHLAFVTPRGDRIGTSYLWLALVGAYRTLRAISEDAGSTKGALTCEDLKRFRIVVPPTAEEQNEICDWIERETAALRKVKDCTEHEIALLLEYRTRLIADVVTGKLDVRAVAASLPDGTEEGVQIEILDEGALDEFEDEALAEVAA